MKRVLSFVLILALIVPVLLVPVLAAEVYEFSHAPVVLPEFDREGDYGLFVCEDSAPPGRYILSLVFGDVTLSSDPFVLDFLETNEIFNCPCSIVEIDVVIEGTPVTLSANFFVLGSGSGFYFLDDQGNVADLLPHVDCYFLEPVPSGLGSVVTSDMLDAVLQEVAALVPVLFGIIVSYVGIRKGLGYLQFVVRGS